MHDPIKVLFPTNKKSMKFLFRFFHNFVNQFRLILIKIKHVEKSNKIQNTKLHNFQKHFEALGCFLNEFLKR